jgi:hypothetical protein
VYGVLFEELAIVGGGFGFLVGGGGGDIIFDNGGVVMEVDIICIHLLWV